MFAFPEYITYECLFSELTLMKCKLWWKSDFKVYTWWLPQQQGIKWPKYANYGLMVYDTMSSELLLKKALIYMTIAQ